MSCRFTFICVLPPFLLLSAFPLFFLCLLISPSLSLSFSVLIKNMRLNVEPPASQPSPDSLSFFLARSLLLSLSFNLSRARMLPAVLYASMLIGTRGKKVARKNKPEESPPLVSCDTAVITYSKRPSLCCIIWRY